MEVGAGVAGATIIGLVVLAVAKAFFGSGRKEKEETQ